MPTRSATANSASDAAPRIHEPTTRSATTGSAEDSVVLSERASTSLVETLATLAKDWREVAKRCAFSLTRSKTTTVS
jgi:hypothetical protein